MFYIFLGTKIEFKLEKNDDVFYLMVGKTNESPSKEDSEKYTFTVSEVFLYVQTATLNVEMYREIEIRWPKEDVLYFFRRFDILEIQLGLGTGGLFSESLWCESVNPLRIYFFLVSYDAYTPGSYTKNPVIFFYYF